MPTSKIVNLPAKGMTTNSLGNGRNNIGNMGKATTLPGKIRPGSVNAGNGTGKFSRMSDRIHNNPMRVSNRQTFKTAPHHFGGGMGGGRFSQRFAAGPSRSSFARGSFGGGGFGGGRSFGGGFGRR
jgi:hypothetical protein